MAFGQLTKPGTLSCLLTAVWLAVAGCHIHSPEVTAVPLSPWNCHEPCGIPYYLPKPLLVVSKNVRHIDGSKVGLTDPAPIPNAFDHQAEYADLKANVTNPSGTGSNTVGDTTYNPVTGGVEGSVPKQASGSLGETVTPGREFDSSLAQDSFFTYQIIFVPDLTQKYGLRIKGGSGEIRAAMNMVNGWMFTGLGPFYLKDSSTAQNRMATGVGAMFAGRGVADVTEAVGDLLSNLPKESGQLNENQLKAFADAMQAIRSSSATEVVPDKVCDYAEIYIYEPYLTPEGRTQWELIAHHNFDRDFLRTTGAVPAEVIKELLPMAKPTSSVVSPPNESGIIEQYQRLKAAQRGSTQKEAGELTAAGGGGVNVDVRVGDQNNVSTGHRKLFGHGRKQTPKINLSRGTVLQSGPTSGPTGTGSAQSIASDETGPLSSAKPQYGPSASGAELVRPGPVDPQLGIPGSIPANTPDPTEELPAP